MHIQFNFCCSTGMKTLYAFNHMKLNIFGSPLCSYLFLLYKYGNNSISCPVFVFGSAVSHSVMSDMQVIEQETPVGTKSSSRSKLDMFDEPGFTSGPPKYVLTDV